VGGERSLSFPIFSLKHSPNQIILPRLEKPLKLPILARIEPVGVRSWSGRGLSTSSIFGLWQRELRAWIKLLGKKGGTALEKSAGSGAKVAGWKDHWKGKGGGRRGKAGVDQNGPGWRWRQLRQPWGRGKQRDRLLYNAGETLQKLKISMKIGRKTRYSMRKGGGGRKYILWRKSSPKQMPKSVLGP